jgi:hypothetical protein
MDQINTIELGDSSIYPNSAILKKVLGEAYSGYCALLDVFTQNEMTHDWRYYKDGKAWLCKVEKKKRTIVWMSAWKGFMKATIYFPEKHIEALYGLDLSDQTKASIKETKNVGKSKPCTFEIRAGSDLSEITKVMQLKIAAK